jgi:hypothetical protein
MHLTDITIRALKLPEKGVAYYTDDALASASLASVFPRLR